MAAAGLRKAVRPFTCLLPDREKGRGGIRLSWAEEIVTRSAVCFGNGLCLGAELIASGLSLSLLTVPETFRTFRHAETRVSDVFRSALVLFRVISYSDGITHREICVGISLNSVFRFSYRIQSSI